MKSTRLTLLLLVLSLCVNAQRNAGEYAAIDKKALELPSAQSRTTQDIAAYINTSFITNTEKVRAIYVWTATNISYDIENMYAIDFHEKEADKIAKALNTHKGICENYAAVFNDVCRKCGIRSFVIAGYTQANGTIGSVPHAWCAAVIDNDWYLFDPTWAAGNVGKDNKFAKKLSDRWFMVKPQEFIISHISFDPMWQLLYHPITNQEFYENKTDDNKLKPRFNYPDSIAVYEQLGETDQWIAAARRIEKNGVKNAMIYNILSNLKQNIEINKQTIQINAHNEIVGIYNEAVEDYNNGIHDINEFVQYRNNQFTPKKEDAAIQSMLDTADHRIKRAHNKLNGLKGDDANITSMIASIQKSIADAEKVLNEQKEFLAKYLSKSKLIRKTMFTKYTWMGMPLN